jgi:RNA polymerase subunit RPABC4/transcription elongation factor Spt4
MMAGTKDGGKVDTGTVLLIVVLAFLFLYFFRGFWPFEHGHWNWGGPWLFWPGWRGLFSIGFLINLVLAVWVWSDANRRGMQGVLWGLLVFVTSIVGLVVYLIVSSGSISQLNGNRSREPQEGAASAGCCSRCRAALQPGFKVCPYCGEPLERKCPSCQRPVHGGWKVCPYCESPLGSGGPEQGRPGP